MYQQTCKKRVALHHPGFYFYTTIFFSKSLNDPLKQKFLAQLKKKGSASFHTTYKIFFTPIKIFFVSFLKILQRLQKFYTILDGTSLWLKVWSLWAWQLLHRMAIHTGRLSVWGIRGNGKSYIQTGRVPVLLRMETTCKFSMPLELPRWVKAS